MTTRETYSISGFGGGYEDLCQKMLWRGVAHLEEHKPPLEMWKGAKTYNNVYGVLITEGDDLKALEEAIIKPEEDVTGAMHQAVMGHLFFIHQHGLDKWREELSKVRPEGPFTWEGTI